MKIQIAGTEIDTARVEAVERYGASVIVRYTDGSTVTVKGYPGEGMFDRVRHRIAHANRGETVTAKHAATKASAHDHYTAGKLNENQMAALHTLEWCEARDGRGVINATTGHALERRGMVTHFRHLGGTLSWSLTMKGRRVAGTRPNRFVGRGA